MHCDRVVVLATLHVDVKPLLVAMRFLRDLRIVHLALHMLWAWHVHRHLLALLSLHVDRHRLVLKMKALVLLDRRRLVLKMKTLVLLRLHVKKP